MANALRPPIYDVIVIGGGPAGLSTALMLGRCRRKVVVIDANSPRNAVARRVNGFLGHDGIEPETLRHKGRVEASKYCVELVSACAVAARSKPVNDATSFRTQFEVETKDGRTFAGRKLLFATGLRDEVPAFPGAAECYGISIHHCPYCDGWEHRDERLLAYDAKANAATHLGLALRTWSKRVTVVTNGSTIDESDRHRLRRNGIDWNEGRITRVFSADGRIEAVEFEGGVQLKADALFFTSRPLKQCELPRALGCVYADDEHVQTSAKQRTSVPGVFFAGDADGDVQFAIVAAAEGATAAVAINRELQKEDRGEDETESQK